MSKVSVFDKKVVRQSLSIIGVVSSAVSMTVIFVDIPHDQKQLAGQLFLWSLLAIYFGVWIWSNNLTNITIDVEGSNVSITVGDIFKQPGLKAIGFNEYFDTVVDNRLIAEQSLNGTFIKSHLNTDVATLDRHLDNYPFEQGDVVGLNPNRAIGKSKQYRIGTICVYNDYLLTAFAKFDDQNRARLTMPEYLEFLITFWDRMNIVYAQQSVATPIFGSGITRIKGHRNISDEDLLKIMLWTFRISEMRFKYPAKLTIVIHSSKINQINLLDIKAARNGV